MFVGHALLAFAVAALVADRWGVDPRRALAVGVLAGAFATLPDVDMAYGIVGLAVWLAENAAQPTPETFWATSGVVHRSITHSLVVGAIAAPAFGLLAVRERGRVRPAQLGAAGLLIGLVAVAFLDGGLRPAAVLALFAGCGAAVALAVARLTTISPLTVGLAAIWGLWSHLVGDLVTGSPPDWFYPLEGPVLTSRILLHSEPTLHLLGAFAIELAVLWAALLTYCYLTDRSWIRHVDRRASFGVAYGVAALVLAPPTLDVSYHFVFSILGAGAVGGVVRRSPSEFSWIPVRRPGTVGWQNDLLDVSLTGLATVTVALCSYAIVYLTIGLR